jgi:hypothetical protein
MKFDRKLKRFYARYVCIRSGRPTTVIGVRGKRIGVGSNHKSGKRRVSGEFPTTVPTTPMTSGTNKSLDTQTATWQHIINIEKRRKGGR